MEAPDTLREAIIWFSEYEHCHQFMMELRWPDGKVTCPRCGSEHFKYLEKARVWKCYHKHDRPTFTLKTGTIFEDSPLGFDKWLPAAWMLINCKNGISSYELSRGLGVTQKTAWFMLHRIRLAMQSGTFNKLDGEVEVDETFIGGKARNMHKYDPRRKHLKGGGAVGKTAIQGLLQRHGEIRARVVVDAKRKTLVEGVLAHVQPGANVYTDDAVAYYKTLDKFAHQVINHAEKYVEGRVHTNGMENFWSLLKRGLNGTYVSVEPFHLFRYVDEQAFRFNNRKLSDPERFSIVMKQIIDRRLTYKQLTGKDDTAEDSDTRPEEA